MFFNNTNRTQEHIPNSAAFVCVCTYDHFRAQRVVIWEKIAYFALIIELSSRFDECVEAMNTAHIHELQITAHSKDLTIARVVVYAAHIVQKCTTHYRAQCHVTRKCRGAAHA